MRAAAALLVLLVVLAGLDLAVTEAAENRASAQASELLGAPATVDLQGWPVSLRLLGGAVPRVTLHAEDVPTESGVPLSRLDAVVTDVRLRLSQLSSGQLPAQARTGTYTAALDESAFERLAGVLGAAGGIELTNGLVRYSVLGATIDATVAIRGDRLLLTPTADLPVRVDGLSLPLPALPRGTTVDRVAVEEGALRIEGTFDPQVFLSQG